MKHTKFPSSTMIPGAISNKWNMMAPFFFFKSLGVTAGTNQEVLRDMVKA